MPRPKVSTLSRVAYSPSASCPECAWEHPSAHETRELAKRHALNTGHEVVTVEETITVYRREEPV